MGKRRSDRNVNPSSKTLPSSPSHSFSSSSSSDFEFTISLSPLKSSSNLCPADELFYKGQLLPLHLSPRISMVRTILLSSARTSTDTSSRDSTGSSNSSDSFLLLNECDSSRPSSVTEEEDELKRLNFQSHQNPQSNQIKKPSKYFSLARFSSVFRTTKNRDLQTLQENVITEVSVSSSVNSKKSSSAKEVIRKYLKKVKPLYEKLSQKQQQKMDSSSKSGVSLIPGKTERSTSTTLVSAKSAEISSSTNSVSNRVNSFSGNLRYPRSRRSCISSCPSSVRSSPSRSGVLPRNNNPAMNVFDSSSSSMKELQSAIQGAIAHCKNSMVQKEPNVVLKLGKNEEQEQEEESTLNRTHIFNEPLCSF